MRRRDAAKGRPIMTWGTGYYFIRRDAKRKANTYYEFYTGVAFELGIAPATYTTLEQATRAWERISKGFREKYRDAYIVGPRGGYYWMDGERMR